METVEQVVKHRIVEDLRPDEKKRLKEVITGYGRLSNAATTAKIHFQTLKNVALTGRGEKSTIEKIRTNLLNKKLTPNHEK